MFKRLCVFCGSSPGENPAYRDAAVSLGHALAAAGIELVYGGASVGLMGAIADATLDAGGQVTGVLPRALKDRELAHPRLSTLHVVGSMHERKAMMAELSDGFIALPGGIGTFEELFEIWTWAQLGQHAKPCALLNVQGFYDGLIAFLDHVVAQRFVRPATRDLLLVSTDVPALLAQMQAHSSPGATKWLSAKDL